MAVTLKNYAYNDAGGPIVGATVQAVGRASPGTHTFNTTTDANGMWTFVSLADDVYDVTVTSGGKVRKHQGDVSLQIGAFVNAAGTTPIGAGTVGPTELAANAVTQAKVADGAIGTAELVDLGVTTAKLAALAVTQAKLAAGAVGNTELAANAVGTAQVQDGAITSAKLAAGAGGGSGSIPDDNSVTTAKIVDGAVTSGKLATNSVTSTKIAADAVGATAIAAGAVGSSELATGAVTLGKVGSGAVDAAAIAAGAVGTSELADSSVATAKIAAKAVTSSRIGDSEVGALQLNDFAVTTAKLNGNAVTWDKLAVENQHARGFTTSGALASLTTSDTDIFSFANLPAGTYLVFFTVQLSGNLAGDEAEFELVVGATVIAPSLVLKTGTTNQDMVGSTTWLATVPSTSTVKVRGHETGASMGIVVDRPQSSFGYVRII